MIQTLKNKLNKKKGFTLAELLIVVAIIAVLVAIAIPVFTAQLDKAAIAADDANYRSAMAACTIANLDAAYSDLELDSSDVPTKDTYFQKDGTWGDATNAVKAQGSGAGEISPNHQKGQHLRCVEDTDGKLTVQWD